MKCYEVASRLTIAVLKNELSALALIGPNGLGKTKIIENRARELKLKIGFPEGIFFINGHKTLPALCRDLDYLNQNTRSGKKTIIVLNDCSLFHSNSPRDVAFMKALLETDRTGEASYSTNNGDIKIDISKLNFIFTANEYSTSQSPHLKAIFDRIHTVTFQLSLKQRIDLTIELFINPVDPRSPMKEVLHQLLFQIIEKIVASKCTKYSLRTFKKLMDIKLLDEGLLIDQLDLEFPINKHLSSYRSIQENGNIQDNEQDKIIRFEKETGLRRRSYFYYKKKYEEWKLLADTSFPPLGYETHETILNRNKPYTEQEEFLEVFAKR